MYNNSLLPSITLPTRINRVNNTLIDNIFMNQFNPNTISGNFVSDISDHLPSFLLIPKPSECHAPKKHNIFVRDKSKLDSIIFLDEIKSIKWDNVLQIKNGELGLDANSSFTIFYKTINDVIDKQLPLK